MTFLERKTFISLAATIVFVTTGSQLLATPIQSDSKPATLNSSQGWTPPQGWLKWNNVRVDVRGGVKLLAPNGSPLRATTLKIYASDIGWQASYGYPGVGFSTQPNDNSTGYAGIILFQPSGPTCPLTAAASAPNGMVCNFNNASDIYAMVHDGTIGSGNDGHDDNGGSFDLHARIMVP